MSDLIDRQKALDAVNDCGICIQKILDIPSAEPEERTAKVKNDGINYCENCEGYVEAPMGYCPYCGARLEWNE